MIIGSEERLLFTRNRSDMASWTGTTRARGLARSEIRGSNQYVGDAPAIAGSSSELGNSLTRGRGPENALTGTIYTVNSWRND